MSNTAKHIDWLSGFAVGSGELTELGVACCHAAASHMEELQRERDEARDAWEELIGKSVKRHGKLRKAIRDALTETNLREKNEILRKALK